MFFYAADGAGWQNPRHDHRRARQSAGHRAAAGLDLPYACRGGVCCTSRARVLEGQVAMAKNFTLEQWEMDKGFVLTCQARPLTPEVTVSFDER